MRRVVDLSQSDNKILRHGDLNFSRSKTYLSKSADETKDVAKQILKNPPEQGYLTISNALQWRLQYQRIVTLSEDIPGISKIVSYNKPK